MSGLTARVREMWSKSVMHRALLVAPPVVFILLAGFWGANGRASATDYTAKVEKGDISQVVQATGTINAVTTVQVGSQVSGNIAALNVDFNSQVKKGDIIAQIDPSILRARLQQSEADLDSARANVKSLEAQIETQRADLLAAKASVDRAQAQLTEAELNLKRTEELFNQGIVAASQRDTVKANYDGMRAGLQVAEAQNEQSKARLKGMLAQLDQAKASVQQRRAATELSRVDLAHTTIVAPIDGTVIARNVDVGQTVAASLSAPTLFMIAQDLTKMLVYAKTDEADVGKIKVGATATFRVDSFPRETFRGKVEQVRMNATTVQNVVTYDTIIEFDNPERKLFPGMTAYVTIPIAWANDVVKVPNGALRFRPDIPEEQIKALYEKHKIRYVDPAAMRRAAAGTGGPGGGATAGGPGGAAFGGGGGNRSGAGGGGNRGPGGGPAGGPGGDQGATPRRPAMAGPQSGVVWKRDKDNQLLPIAVRLGVTDFTFTEMKEGGLQPGDELIIGQTSTRSTTARQQGGPTSSPMGGPGGIPRRF